MARKLRKNPWLSGRRRSGPKHPVARVPVLEEEPERMVIEGQEADSKEEYWVSLALDGLPYGYAYQVPVFGGRQLRGGQILDFLVYTPGKWTVLDVRGLYWHTGRRERTLELERAVRRKGWLLVVIWDYEIPTRERAREVVRARLPHG